MSERALISAVYVGGPLDGAHCLVPPEEGFRVRVPQGRRSVPEPQVHEYVLILGNGARLRYRGTRSSAAIAAEHAL